MRRRQKSALDELIARLKADMAELEDLHKQLRKIVRRARREFGQ